MRSGDVREMEDRWISRAHPRLIPVTSGSTPGKQEWHTQLPPMPSPGYPSPATAAMRDSMTVLPDEDAPLAPAAGRLD
jgi:hypothetical protein